VIATSFDYTRATSLDDAIARLKDAKGTGKLIAGGHSLVPLMKLRLSEPGLLIDIARIQDLAGIKRAGDTIEIGALTVHHEVAASPVIRDACPMLTETAASIGDQQVRNRGTIGGSLAHADPAADYPAAMLALDADILIAGAKGKRVVKASKFFKGLFTVDLGDDEIITAVQFTPVRTAAYAKLHQRASHFAIVGVAAALDIAGGVIKDARIGVTGATPSAKRLMSVEHQLNGKKPSADVFAAASKNAGADLKDVNGDLHASEDYRRAMVAVFTRRALDAALARPSNP
jgi:carbon-monoxide dehydrogenase medium subunit